jgi:hypothetical protein
MANEIKIVIKAKNEVSPAVKAAQREIEELRQPLLRTRGIIVGLGQVLRGDFAGGFATMGRSAMGTFGTIIGKLGAIGAAFGAEDNSARSLRTSAKSAGTSSRAWAMKAESAS